MSASKQQDDIYDLFVNEFPDIAVIAEDRGATEADADLALAPRKVRNGKTAGMVVIVGLPNDKALKADSFAVTYSREFPVRVIEDVRVNRPPGQALATGYTAAELAEEVVSLLHSRGIYGATLRWTGTEPAVDGKGGVGYAAIFEASGGVAVPTRAANPLLDFAAGNCTLSAGGGATIYYTTDGTSPLGEDRLTYSTPFAVTSGAEVRCVAVESGKQPSDFMREVAP